MKIKVSYNDLTLIIGLIEERIKPLNEGIEEMRKELAEIERAEGTDWGLVMKSDAAMRHKELVQALSDDRERCQKLDWLLLHLKEDC